MIVVLLVAWQAARGLPGPVSQPTTIPASQPTISPAASGLDREVRAALAAGRSEEALRLVRQALKVGPGDPAVQAQYADVHVAIALRMADAEEFGAVDRLLDGALRVVPEHADGLALRQRVAQARASVDSRVGQARQWLELEWFESAAAALRRARSLAPQRAAEWNDLLVEATVGAADDMYLSKNFGAALDRYAAGAALIAEARMPPERIDQFAMQVLVSIIAAPVEDDDAWRCDEGSWKRRVGVYGSVQPSVARLRRPSGPDPKAAMDTAREIIDRWNLARSRALRESPGTRPTESTGTDRAAPRAEDVVPPEDIVLRRPAAAAASRFWCESCVDRRSGVWQQHDAGEWAVSSSPHFTLHHRNETVARRVAMALEFHFERIAELWGSKVESVPWSRRCDVWLHADRAALLKAVPGRAGDGSTIRGSCVIELRGTRLVSHAIHLSQDDLLLLSTTIPHELSHAMLAAFVGYRMPPAVLREGIALQAEPLARAMQFRRLLPTAPQRRSVAELLAMTVSHPADAPAYYAEAFGLTEMCLRPMRMPELIEACRADDVVGELLRRLRLKDLAEFDTMWRGAPASNVARQAPQHSAGS